MPSQVFTVLNSAVRGPGSIQSNVQTIPANALSATFDCTMAQTEAANTSKSLSANIEVRQPGGTDWVRILDHSRWYGGSPNPHSAGQFLTPKFGIDLQAYRGWDIRGWLDIPALPTDPQNSVTFGLTMTLYT